MTTFAKASFNALSYAASRPSYPQTLFTKVLTYHRGPKTTLLDLGCGHGLISRSLSPTFTSILATDPSSSMITQASSSTSPSKYPNIEFRQASAEDLSFVEDGSLDMVVAGQAAHWFDFTKVWPELARKVRKGGTVAFWGYKDNVFPDHPVASKILDHYCYADDTMGPYWEQTGREILRKLYRDIIPPSGEWEEVERIEYEPGLEGPRSGKGECLMYSKAKLGEMEGYVRTFSAYHNWKSDGKNEGKRDVCEEMFGRMVEEEVGWKEKGEEWRDIEVENEWGSVILLMRRK